MECGFFIIKQKRGAKSNYGMGQDRRGSETKERGGGRDKERQTFSLYRFHNHTSHRNVPGFDETFGFSETPLFLFPVRCLVGLQRIPFGYQMK
jgi:hypothetical protein